MMSALESLRLDRLYVVHAGRATFDLGTKVRAVAAADLLEEFRPRRA